MVKFKALSVKPIMLAMGVGLMASSVSAFSQTDNVAEYEALLAEIADMKLAISHREANLVVQQNRIESLEAQLASVEDVKASVGPMLDKMVATIENEINSDLPFKLDERFPRFQAFQEIVADKAASPIDKIRRGLAIYDIEVGYGQNLEAYAGDHPTEPEKRAQACRENIDSSACAVNEGMREQLALGATIEDLIGLGEVRDGTYLRYGRLALSYMSADGSEALNYDREQGGWVAIAGTRVNEMRRAIRIARGESAPGVVTAPVLVSN